MKLWKWEPENLPSVVHSIRTAIAATISLAVAVFVLGFLCAAFRMEKSAYRYASVTLAIIMLIPRSNAAWIVAVHRFFEVSVGILVALAVTAVWSERQPKSANQSAE
jgi:uncharacterized membrane protein YgaE (UPF0421/DUF939 family)